MTGTCTNLNEFEYFKILEQERQYEILRCDRKRRLKQQQLWFSDEGEQENPNISMEISELPTIEQIVINDSQILNINSLQRIQIRTDESESVPDSFYERLLICLHSIFNERLDYLNFTLGRTIDKYLIKIERSNPIQLTISSEIFERIETLLEALFLFYPNTNLRIET